VLLVGCGGQSPTGPALDTWRGAQVSSADLGARLEAAWPRVEQRFPRWSPERWSFRDVQRILVEPDMRCGSALCVDRGITEVIAATFPRTRQGQFTPQASSAHIAWELCNAARIDLTGQPADQGCL